MNNFKLNLIILLLAVFLLRYLRATKLETDFVNHVGNERDVLGEWKLIRNWCKDDKSDKQLKKFCIEVHKEAGLGEKKVDTVSIDQHTLKFLDPKFKRMRVDVVTYGIDLEGQDPETESKYWYIMEGLRPDCVYYLVPVNAFQTWFSLFEHVCNITLNIKN